MGVGTPPSVHSSKEPISNRVNCSRLYNLNVFFSLSPGFENSLLNVTSGQSELTGIALHTLDPFGGPSIIFHTHF